MIGPTLPGGPGLSNRVRLLRGNAVLTAPGVLPGFRVPQRELWAG